MSKPKYFVLLLFFNLSPLIAQFSLTESIRNALRNSNYIICIDGGGSKTELQVLDKYGELVALKQNDIKDDTIAYSIKSGGSNINVLGENGVKKTLDMLLGDLKITQTDASLKSIALQCAVIGGFSGAGRIEAQNTIKNLFKSYGFDENKIIIVSDADMALASVDGDGIILISGTGSICFGKNGMELVRVGGLGKVVGDQGSGYYIGLHAIKAALEDEYGWGTATTLKKCLQDYFKTSDLKSIIGFLNKGEITNYQVASIAPIVFEQAKMNDPVALKIINKAVKKLGDMLVRMVQNGKFLTCPIYFFGGTFKNKDAIQFIQKILQEAHLASWQTFNMSENNPTVLAVQRIQKQVYKN